MSPNTSNYHHDMTQRMYDSLAVKCSVIVLNNVPLVQVQGTWMQNVDINLTDDIIVEKMVEKKHNNVLNNSAYYLLE